MSELKIFDKWTTGHIKVTDLGLQDYINLKPIIVPRTCGRNIGTQFWKSKSNIVERLINKLMIPGHKGKKHKISSGRCGGKAITTYHIVEKTFMIIERKTHKNPIEVFVQALENAAPREEITTIEYGGARYPKAVECAPQRRIDIALKLMVQGSYANSYGKKKSIEDALSEEIIKAYNLDQNSNAIGKKLETERQSDASR
ncbi:30S ribosomal protein S7 [Candidatus Woesearchaeota archaeon]|nr:30S ribosomal protein S7 [Candidatus Woesearchaeota archaeon]